MVDLPHRMVKLSRIAPLATAVLNVVAFGTNSTCPYGFAYYAGGCYMFSNQTATFTQCQDLVCGPRNSSLATIGNGSLNEMLYSFVQGKGWAFIGLYERGENESGDWAWVDGTITNTTPYWRDGEPNNYCRDEDCVVISDDSNGWLDVACDTRNHCLCQYGSNATSQDYLASLQNLEKMTSSWCTRRVGPVGIVACFWYRDLVFQVVFLLLGVPSTGLIMYVLACSCGNCLGLRTGIGRFSVQLHDALSPSPYGQLLDIPAEGGGFEAFIGGWVVRGAQGEMLYAGALLALAASVTLHVSGSHMNFVVDTIEALVMFTCKLAVALSVAIIYRRLSPFASAVAGPWVLILAYSKLAMALCALALAGINFILLNGDQEEYRNLCLAGYIFCWTLLLSFVFQCISGLAAFRIYERAAGYSEDSRVFSRLVGCNFGIFVGSTFGVGLGLGVCAALFVYDDPNDNVDPFKGIGLSYALAAICQLVNGAAMLYSNQRVQAHFCKEQRTIQSMAGLEMSSYRDWCHSR